MKPEDKRFYLKYILVAALLLFALGCAAIYLSTPKEYCIKNHTLGTEYCTDNLTKFQEQVEFIKRSEI